MLRLFLIKVREKLKHYYSITMETLVAVGASLIFLFRVFFFFMGHPLRLALTLILAATVSCLLWGVLLRGWYSLIIFLLYVGALLVLFAYISALSPNYKFRAPLLLWLLPLLGLCLVFPFGVYSRGNSAGRTGHLFLGGIRAWQLGELGTGGLFVLVFLGVILLACLIAVVTVCKRSKRALRGWQ